MTFRTVWRCSRSVDDTPTRDAQPCCPSRDHRSSGRQKVNVAALCRSENISTSWFYQQLGRFTRGGFEALAVSLPELQILLDAYGRSYNNRPQKALDDVHPAAR